MHWDANILSNLAEEIEMLKQRNAMSHGFNIPNIRFKMSNILLLKSFAVKKVGNHRQRSGTLTVLYKIPLRPYPLS